TEHQADQQHHAALALHDSGSRFLSATCVRGWVDPRRVVALTGWADCIQLLKSFVSLFFRISSLLSPENVLQETCLFGQLMTLACAWRLYLATGGLFLGEVTGVLRKGRKNCVQFLEKVS
ncbi:MAG: hypothetical protein ACLGJA_25820, partial [Gammaproteobacteria bacterium]